MITMVFRKDLISLLLDRSYTLLELAELLEIKLKAVEDDVERLLRSVKHHGYRAIVEPAHCRRCGFEFHKGKLHRPSRCPHCKSTWIADPRIGLEKI